jgi:hypothetical protein
MQNWNKGKKQEQKDKKIFKEPKLWDAKYVIVKYQITGYFVTSANSTSIME